jgi:hypothetical protein
MTETCCSAGEGIMENEFTFVAGQYRCVAVRCDRAWGHGLRVSIHDGHSGHLLNTVQFACHPEFAGYDQLQAMSTEQLISIAKTKLESGALDENLAKARAAELGLIVRFEMPVL